MPNYLQAMAGRLGRGMGIDPRRRFAQQLMAQGVDTSPAHLGTGIGRLGKALAAAYMMRQSQGQEAEAMKWLTGEVPEGEGRTRPPTREETLKARPDLEMLRLQSLPSVDLPESGEIPNIIPDYGPVPQFPPTEEAEVPIPSRDGTSAKEQEVVGGFDEWFSTSEGQASSEDDPNTIVEEPDLAEMPEGIFDATPSPSPTPTTGGPPDYAKQLASGMTAYQSDPANQISDPRTRMEWLRESYRNNPELKNNWFANRLIQNLMFNEIARGDEDIKWKREQEGKKELKQMEIEAKDTRTTNEKDFDRAQRDPAFQTWKEKFASTKRPAAAIQYWNQRQEMIKNNATDEDLARFDSYVRAPKVLDTGSGFQIRSGVNTQGATPTIIPKDIPLEQRPAHLGEVAQVKAERKFEGEKIAEARWEAPQAKREVDSMLSLLDQIYTRGSDGTITSTHPGFEGVVGSTWKPGMRFLHGTQEFAMDKLIKQVKDKNFLQAFQALKGGGHITEIEGEKATDSIAAIHIGMPEKDFIVELEKVRKVLQTGLAIAQRKMTGTMQQPGGDRRGRSGSGRVAPGWDPEDWKFLTDAEKKEAWGKRQ